MTPLTDNALRALAHVALKSKRGPWKVEHTTFKRVTFHALWRRGLVTDLDEAHEGNGRVRLTEAGKAEVVKATKKMLGREMEADLRDALKGQAK